MMGYYRHYRHWVIKGIAAMSLMTIMTISCAPKQRVEVVNPSGNVDTMMVRRVIRTEK